MRLVVTGATGFIGAHIVAAAKSQGLNTYAPSRNQLYTNPDFNHGDIIIHCAAAIPRKKEETDQRFLSKANVELTSTLAKAAVHVRAQRFIFLSSIAAMGEATPPNKAFTVTDELSPVSHYGKSKKEAEDALRRILEPTDVDFCIIRAPLVYGPGVKTAFQKLCLWVMQGSLLPFGGLRGQRHLLGIRNLLDLVFICMSHPNAANTTFLAADEESLSTAQLIHRIANAANRKARLVSIPPWLLQIIAMPLRKHEMIQRLNYSLLIDTSHAQQALGWQPRVTLDEEIQSTVESL
jgi:nucleoside-diphosphate-sugar epimerase